MHVAVQERHKSNMVDESFLNMPKNIDLAFALSVGTPQPLLRLDHGLPKIISQFCGASCVTTGVQDGGIV